MLNGSLYLLCNLPGGPLRFRVVQRCVQVRRFGTLGWEHLTLRLLPGDEAS